MEEYKINKRIVLKEDSKAKSKSFYLLNPYQKVDKSISNFLENYSKKNNYCDVRVCIHESPNSKHHDMYILHHKKNYYIPHAHKDCGDTYVVINGKLGCILFSKSGKITYSCILKKGEMFKVPSAVYHTIIPISNKVLFFEMRNGPYKQKKTSTPRWCPSKYSSKKEIDKYKKKLSAYL